MRGLVAYTDNPGFYRVRYALPKTPRVQAVIPGEFSHAERRWLEARLQAATAYPDFHVCVGREAEGLIEALAAGSREPEGFVLFLNPSVYPMNGGGLGSWFPMACGRMRAASPEGFMMKNTTCSMQGR